MKSKRLNVKKLLVSIFVTIGVLALLGAASCAPAPTPKKKKKPILIGISEDITGFNADAGRAERDAIIMAIKEWNKRGGIDGRKIKYIVRDNAGDPTKARTIAKEYVRKDITAFFGGTSSTVGIPENKVMAKNQIPSLGGAASTKNFVEGPDGKWYYFSLCSANPVLAKVSLPFFAEKGYKKIAYIISAAAWPKNLRDISKKRLKEYYGPKYGMEVVADMEVDVEAEDITTQVSKLKKIDPDAIQAIFYPKNAKAYYRAAVTLDWLPVPPTTQYWALMESVYLTAEPETLWGTVCYSNYHEEKKKFVEKKEKFMDMFGYEPVGHFAFAYDGANILFKAIDEVGTEGPAIRDWLETKAKGTPIICGVPGATADFTKETWHSLMTAEDFAFVRINKKGEKEWLE